MGPIKERTTWDRDGTSLDNSCSSSRACGVNMCKRCSYLHEFTVESTSIHCHGPHKPSASMLPGLPQLQPQARTDFSRHGAEAAEVLVSSNRSKSKCQFAAGKPLGLMSMMSAARHVTIDMSIVSEKKNTFGCKGRQKPLTPQKIAGQKAIRGFYSHAASVIRSLRQKSDINPQILSLNPNASSWCFTCKKK